MQKSNKTRQGYKQQTKASKQAIASVSHNNSTVYIALSALLLITFLIYYKAISFGFLETWDDVAYIKQNEAIKSLTWHNIKLFFSDFYVWNYQPLTIMTYAIEYKLVGQNAWLFHLNNILLHLANTYLVFILVRKIASSQHQIVAMFTAAFFAIHPMHVESVAWISERKDVLYAFFFILSLIFYVNYLKQNKNKDLLLSFFFFLFSCLSKSAAVVLPVCLLLFDYFLNRKFSVKVWVEKTPFFLLSLVFGIVALYSQKTAIINSLQFDFVERWMIVSHSFASYILKAFFPFDLSAIYPYPNDNAPLTVGYYISVFLVGLCVYFVWYSKKWGKDIIFGFGFFVITLVLVLQILSVGNAAMADRYTYLPYIGVFFVVGKIMAKIYVKKKSIVLIFAGIFFAGFVFIAHSRIKVWKNDDLLFSDVLIKHPNSQTALINRGVYNMTIAQTDSINSKNLLNKAVMDFTLLINLNERFNGAFFNRAWAFFHLKEYRQCIQDMNMEISYNPTNSQAYFCRGNAKYELGDYSGAINDYDKVIAFDYNHETAYFNRGNAHRALNNYSDALGDYGKALALNPSYIDVYRNRSLISMILKDYKGAIADFDKILEQTPNDQITLQNKQIIQSLVNNNQSNNK